MKALIVRWMNLSGFWRSIICVTLALLFFTTFFWGLIGLAGLPSRRVAAWTFAVVWVGHQIVAAGAGYAIIRLWPGKRNSFVKYSAVYLSGTVVDALGAIVLIFMARNVHFTWKFSLTLFAFALACDAVRLPLLLYIIRGPGLTLHDADKSGEMPPDFWRKEFREAIRDEIKPEFLKEIQL